MVRILLGDSGSGKTYFIKRELLVRENIKRCCCIVERSENEYSRIFSQSFVNIRKLNELQLLSGLTNADIIIDCNISPYTMDEKILKLAKEARKNGNNITIAFCAFDANSQYQQMLFSLATEILLFDERPANREVYSYMKEMYKNVQCIKENL